ncbi:MAG: hypothetical protein Q8P67_24560 [archaeon]|nr:hypothetical protein [archaeon]
MGWPLCSTVQSSPAFCPRYQRLAVAGTLQRVRPCSAAVVYKLSRVGSKIRKKSREFIFVVELDPLSLSLSLSPSLPLFLPH